MRVVCLGTGDAFHGGGRGHSALLVEDSLGRFLVDCGASTPQAVARRGLFSKDIDAVVLTHLHGDHFVGVVFLLLEALYGAPRDKPFVVAGPPGTSARIESLLRLCYGRAADKRRPFLMDYREFEPGESIDLAGRRVTGFKAAHMGAGETALCLRIESEGKVLAVSGDTAPVATLAELADGAHLFVCECSLARRNPDIQHLSVEDLVELRPRWNTPRVVLTHLSGEARQAAAGLERLIVADDGDAFDV